MPAKLSSPLWLDCSASSVVVGCRLCGHWRAMRFTKLDAWRAAAAHEARLHPESIAAQRALAKYIQRHGETAA